MILGVDPEDGDHRGLAVRPTRARELDGGDGLEQGVERAAERARLLAGDDRDGARVGQLRGRRARFGRRAAALLLRGEHGGDLRGGARDAPATRAITSRQASGVTRIARVERRDVRRS